MMADKYPDAQHSPPEINLSPSGVAQTWRSGTGQDPAKRVPYSLMRHSLPYITAGKEIFVWPIGVEGFRHFGSAAVAIHKYLGRNYVDAHTTHRDEAHIEMTGMFAGLTSVANMRDLKTILTAVGAKNLYLPGVFSNIQVVHMENYDFSHDAEDRTHSISYSISFVRTVTGEKVSDKPLPALVPSQASRLTGVSTESERVFTLTDGAQTLRTAASVVYGDAGKWTTLLDLNANNPALGNLDRFGLATVRLEVGTKLRF